MPFNPNNFSWTSFKFGHKKSAGFQAIETALETYLGVRNTNNFRLLEQSIANWKAAKDDWNDSIRADAIKALEDWMEHGGGGLWAASEAGWTNENCYAYAAKHQGGSNNARPGTLAGHPRAKKTLSHPFVANQVNFADGVVEDAQHQLLNAWVHQQGGVPLAVPVPAHGGYMVAMVSNEMGYHFLRRDNATQLWSHKNGSASKAENFYYSPNNGNQRIAINDAGILEILTNPACIGCGMVFDAFIEFPAPGMHVA